MSIIPGIEIAAPERTDTRSGLRVVAEAFPGALLEGGDVLVHLGVQALRHLTARGEVGATGVRREGEAVGYGDAELRHLGEPDPLAAEELAAAAHLLVEVVDVAHLRGEYTGTRQGAETRMVTWSSLP